MSHSTRAIVAAKNAVSAPTVETTTTVTGCVNSGKRRAVTIVAAWIRAETGVGPSIASGSHVYNGNWADFPVAPVNSSSDAVTMTGGPGVGGWGPMGPRNSGPQLRHGSQDAR